MIVLAAAILEAGTMAWSCVAESKVVTTAVPFNVMALPATKPTPVAVKEKAALPAATDEGEIEVRLNVCGPLPVMVNCIALEVVVSGLITLILTLPATAICAADTDAVSCVLETTVVGREIPFHRICVPLV